MLVSMFAQNTAMCSFADQASPSYRETLKMFKYLPSILRNQDLTFGLEKHVNSLPCVRNDAGCSASRLEDASWWRVAISCHTFSIDV